MKGCELCDRAARMYCESDQASLCWECDGRVHGANFLVARHSRILLCRRCQSPTPWHADGARLGPTFSVCERCAGRSGDEGGKVVEWSGEEEEEEEEIEESGGDDEDEEDDEEEEEEEGGEVNGEGEEEDGENQVVPWTLTPPPMASSSSSEESSSRMCDGFLKRMRDNADLISSQDNHACSSPQASYHEAEPDPSHSLLARFPADDEATSFTGALRASKYCRRSGDQLRSTTTSDTASAALGLLNGRDSWPIDFLSSRSHSPPI